MKRTKLITFLLTISIMVIGVGYAAWSEKITINTSSETGNFNVELREGSVVVYQNSGTTTEPSNSGIKRTATVIKNADGSGAVTVTNLYPGARAVVTIPVINESSIPVQISSVKTVDSDNNYSVTSDYTEEMLKPEVGEGKIELTINVNEDANQNTPKTFQFIANFEQFNK